VVTYSAFFYKDDIIIVTCI